MCVYIVGFRPPSLVDLSKLFPPSSTQSVLYPAKMGSIAPPDTHVVLIGLPAFGHVRPAIALATNLIALGYSVTVITGSTYKEKVEAIKGAEFVCFKGEADVDHEIPLADRFPDRPKENTMMFDMEKVFLSSFADQYETVKEVIERPDLRDRRVVIVQDGSKQILPP